jgi:hypothetical protein
MFGLPLTCDRIGSQQSQAPKLDGLVPPCLVENAYSPERTYYPLDMPGVAPCVQGPSSVSRIAVPRRRGRRNRSLRFSIKRTHKVPRTLDSISSNPIYPITQSPENHRSSPQGPGPTKLYPGTIARPRLGYTHTAHSPQSHLAPRSLSSGIYSIQERNGPSEDPGSTWIYPTLTL